MTKEAKKDGIDLLPFTYSDMGNADRLITYCKDEIRFVNEWQSWIHWTGTHWKLATNTEMLALARETIALFAKQADVKIKELTKKALVEELSGAEADKLKALRKHVAYSRSHPKQKSMLENAAGASGIIIESEQLNCDRYLFNALNGLLDLNVLKERSTLTLTQHQKCHFLTKICAVEFDASAQCPTFDRFMKTISCGDNAKERHLLKLIGYCLTGEVIQQQFYVWCGEGCNGKSTLIEVMQALLGNYAHQAPESLLRSRDRNISNDVAGIDGARLVVISEIDDEQKIPEGLLKQLTGGDRVRARKLFKDFYEFDMHAKLVLICNQFPRFKSNTRGMKRRIHHIAFDAQITEEQRDPYLIDKLRAELSGILNRALLGLHWYFQEGLKNPNAQAESGIIYTAEPDYSVQPFLQQACALGANQMIKSGELYYAYANWCKANELQAIGQKPFSQHLEQLKHKKDRKSGHVWWFGIGLVNAL